MLKLWWLLKMRKGNIIVIEGSDKSGKETQTKLLVERLNREGQPCQLISFPRYNTPTGRIIGQCYLGKKNIWEGDTGWFGDADALDPRITSLYYAADRLAAAPDIIKMTNEGTHAVLDRYYQSNMAHQGGKIKDKPKRMAFFEFERLLELELLKIPKEDIAFFLHMPTEVAVELRKRGNIEADLHEANINHLKNAEATYLEMVKTYWYNWKLISCAPDRTLGSLRSPEDIAEEIHTHLINSCIIKYV